MTEPVPLFRSTTARQSPDSKLSRMYLPGMSRSPADSFGFINRLQIVPVQRLVVVLDFRDLPHKPLAAAPFDMDQQVQRIADAAAYSLVRKVDVGLKNAGGEP